MFIAKCPVCGSSHTSKNGKRSGVQIYVCKDCHYQFRITRKPSDEYIWSLYQDRKQTIAEIASCLDLSVATIKRSLHNVSKIWKQPPLSGGGYIHLDATYWGHNWGVLVALDTATGMPLYISFIRNETTADYVAAVTSIRERGYAIKGIIIDGKQSLFKEFADYKIQMCQFHMKEIIKRYLTNNPRLKAAQSLKDLMNSLTKSTKDVFVSKYAEWKGTWDETLNKRSVLKSGKSHFKHKRLRSAMHSLDFFLPYLFTFENPECDGMPNTNNKIEGTFTDLKKNLNTHSGMSEENRKRFIIGFFLALLGTHSMKKQDPR